MAYDEITMSVLTSINLGHKQLDLFTRMYGKDGIFPLSDIEIQDKMVCEQFDIGYIAKSLLTADDICDYGNITFPITGMFNAVAKMSPHYASDGYYSSSCVGWVKIMHYPVYEKFTKRLALTFARLYRHGMNIRKIA